MALQVGLGALFAALVHHPAFDEPLYRIDADRYRDQGVSRATLNAQQGAAPPLMPILTALAGRLSPGDFRAYRLPIIALWLASVALVVALARSSGEPTRAWTLFLLFCFPHVPISIGTLMTEGPATTALLAAVACTLWGLTSSRHNRTSSLALALASGLCAGVALLFRHYALAIAIAVPLTWWVATRRWQTALLASLGTIAALALMYALWGGLMSPSFVSTGGPERKTFVGLN